MTYTHCISLLITPPNHNETSYNEHQSTRILIGRVGMGPDEARNQERVCWRIQQQFTPKPCILFRKLREAKENYLLWNNNASIFVSVNSESG
jgi:hypothetical protein